jgi:MFS family permease
MFIAVFGSASVIGPVVGGFFAGANSILGVSGWRWIFYINVPVALVALIVVTRVLHLPQRRENHRIDWPGALALVVGLVPLLIVAEQGRLWGWGSGRALLCYAVGVVGLVLFLWCERRYGDEALLPLRLFRGRTFAVGTATSVIVGMAMLGTMLMLPLYLQVVRGASPTAAGLQVIPLVAGIMVGAITFGQVISRTGRYRVFPLAGTALMVVALLLFTQVGADTPLWLTMIVMALFGLGLSGNMQPIVLAVQNAVSPREIGVATSAVTFFRSMGGTVGAAAFLAILFADSPGNIRSEFSAAAQTPEFVTALRANPDQAQLLATAGTGGAGALDDTSFLTQLAPVLAHPFKVGFSDAMNLAFLVAALIMLVGAVVVWFLPELPLRKGSAAMERAAEDAAEG